MRTKTKQLTRRQVDVLRAIQALEARQHYAPSVREIGREIRLSPGTVHEHLVALEQKGYLRRTGDAFGLRLLRRLGPPAGAGGRAFSQVPVRGTIAAGRPLEAFEEQDRLIPMPDLVAPDPELFYLRVRGDSMRDDAILDGDLILVRQQDSVDEGEIAVCLLEDGTATLKRVFREGGRVRLQPANEEHEPIFVESVTIQGKVVGVHRIL